MDELKNYPMAPFINALSSTLGRMFLAIFAVILGTFLGGLTTFHTWAGGVECITQIFIILMGSLLFGIGVITLPVALILVFIFIRYEWPLWTICFVTLFVWGSTHASLQSISEIKTPMDKVEENIRAASPTNVQSK